MQQADKSTEDDILCICVIKLQILLLGPTLMQSITTHKLKPMFFQGQFVITKIFLNQICSFKIVLNRFILEHICLRTKRS